MKSIPFTKHVLSDSFSYARLANSDLVSQMTRPNGITTTWSYEADRDLITQVQNGTVSTYGYVNDAIRRRTAMSRAGSAYANPDTISYTYNDRSELTGAQSNVDATYSYSYDPIGNRISASEAGVPWTYTTNSLNQYTSATENNVQLSFSYDLDGSMTYRPVDATSGWTQVWNGENRMVETYKGSDRLTFTYDYMGSRVEKCVYSNNTVASKTYYVYDGFKCVEELDGLNGNAVTMCHTWLPFDVGLDVILATTDGNATSNFLHDANKNVVQNIFMGGMLQKAYIYAPFGKAIAEDYANIGFSSEFFTLNTELAYYNYRYYNLRLGRWNKRESIEEQGGLNLYNFLYNNPANKIDMFGRTAAVLPWETTLPWKVILPGAGGIAIVDGPIPIGDAIAIGIVGGAIVIEVGIKVGDLVSDFVKKCKPKVCPPCPPPRPPETRIDHVPPSRPHYPCKGTHIHTYIYKYNQNPKTCECFEDKEKKVDCL